LFAIFVDNIETEDDMLDETCVDKLNNDKDVFDEIRVDKLLNDVELIVEMFVDKLETDDDVLLKIRVDKLINDIELIVKIFEMLLDKLVIEDDNWILLIDVDVDNVLISESNEDITLAIEPLSNKSDAIPVATSDCKILICVLVLVDKFSKVSFV
jgi:hypothetical protein